MEGTRDIGCLLIEDPLYDIDALDDLYLSLHRNGVRAARFIWDRHERFHPSLQRAYQRIRRDDAVNGIVAIGAGCDCALALACQLPAERLALLEPVDWQGRGEDARQLRRIRSFARRNAAFCVADALIVPGPNTDDACLKRLGRDLCACRRTLFIPSEELWSNRKEEFNFAILHFLRDGAAPKSLAENPEMCIIYG